MSTTQNGNPTAAHQAHERIVENTDLYADIIDVAGGYDAKVDSSANCSLAAHLLNAVTIGVNTFVYEAVGYDESIAEYKEEIKVLAAALALHDTNKYVREAYGFDAEGNTTEAFDYYFDPDQEDESGDDFGIEAFLGGDYRDDLHYLVQRTEVGEDSTETRAIDTEFVGLERYCRIGDSVASVALKQGVKGVHRKLAKHVGHTDVHFIEFTALEQPILNDTLLSVTKEVIAGETEREACGVIIGSSSEALVYLGDPIERSTLRETVAERAPEQISAYFDFDCKLTWNSFDYDILAETAIPIDQKEDRIKIQARNLLLNGEGRNKSFESVPNEFTEYLPILIKAIYEEGRKKYPTQQLTTAYEEVYDSIEGSKNRKAQKIKIEFLAHLCSNYDKYSRDFETLREEIEEELHKDLEPKTDAIDEIVERFFEGLSTPELGGKGSMCYLCGSEANTRYSKGNKAIYRTYEYSRRLPPHEEYKSICEVCNLEYALLADLCERSDVSTNSAVEIAHFYFDDFLGDVRVRSRRIGSLVQGDGDELDDPEMRTSLMGPQYFLQPMYVLDENHRMAIVRQVMQAAQDAGMKVVIGRPFTRFESPDAVFADEETTRPQELLGLDEIERFGPLPDFIEEDRTDSHLHRALQLFKIVSMVGQEANLSNPYLHLDRDTFHSIVDFAVVNHESATRLSELREYLETYHEHSLMDMKTVAERGIDLFGKQYDSKYKKTKIFREAIDAFLSAKHQRMNDGELVEYVESQVYAAADREDYAGYVDPAEAQAFTEAIQTYLIENDLYELKKLSDWEDALVNSYYYAYDQALTNQ